MMITWTESSLAKSRDRRPILFFLLSQPTYIRVRILVVYSIMEDGNLERLLAARMRIVSCFHSPSLVVGNRTTTGLLDMIRMALD